MAVVSVASAIECLLFAAEEPLPIKALAEALNMTVGEASDHLDGLRMACETGDRGLQVIEVAGGFRLVTKPEYAAYVERLRHPQRIRLSRASLETLAIVAYRQPVTAAEVEQIRGVNSSGVLATLLERELIESSGRREGPGRPRLYATTQSFLDLVGINSLSDLPKLEDAETDAQVVSLFREGGLSEVEEEEPSPPEGDDEPGEAPHSAVVEITAARIYDPADSAAADTDAGCEEE